MYYARSSSVPFAKAILESGATTARATFYPTHPRHLIQFREFLVAAGIEGVPESSVFATLRTLPAATILKASKSLWDKYEPSVTWPFQPVIDGPNGLSNSSHADTAATQAVIPDLPILSWQRGHHLAIPVLTGFNTNEGTVFIPANANTTAEFRSFFSALIPGFGPSDLDALEALYPDPVTDASSPYKAVPEGMGAQWARLDAAYSHYAYICPVLHTAHFLSTASSNNPSPSFSKSTHNSYGLRSATTPPPRPVYVYRYAAAAKWGTANHGDEAPVVAHDMLVISPPTSPSASASSSAPPPPSHSPASSTARPGLRRVADAMHAAWVNFVVSPAGDPSPVGGSSWPAFVSPFAGGGGGAGRGEMVVFGRGNDERWTEKGIGRRSAEGTPVGLETLTDWELERCRFWWDRVELSEGVGKRLDRGRL